MEISNGLLLFSYFGCFWIGVWASKIASSLNQKQTNEVNKSE